MAKRAENGIALIIKYEYPGVEVLEQGNLTNLLRVPGL